jgi:ornithine cyclodeaminase
VEALPAASAEACVADANVVITITKSAEAGMPGRVVAARGAHVNAAGANSGDRREVRREMVLRAAVKATDHVDQAKVEAGEFRDLVAEGKLAWSDIASLGTSSPARPRAAPRRPT